MRRMIIAAIALVGAIAAPPAFAASEHIARVKGGDIPVYDGPGRDYHIIGRIPDGTEVPLEFCTPELTNWCVVSDTGWVDGTYLVGSRAKMRVTPHMMPDPLPFRYMHFGPHRHHLRNGDW